MQVLLAHLREGAEFVIIDGPSVSALEARALVSLSDAVLVVWGSPARRALEAVAAAIAATKTIAVGIVHT